MRFALFGLILAAGRRGEPVLPRVHERGTNSTLKFRAALGEAQRQAPRSGNPMPGLNLMVRAGNDGMQGLTEPSATKLKIGS